MIPQNLENHFSPFDNIEFREIPLDKEKINSPKRKVLFLNKNRSNNKPISQELLIAFEKAPELVLEGVKIADNYFVTNYTIKQFNKSIDAYISWF